MAETFDTPEDGEVEYPYKSFHKEVEIDGLYLDQTGGGSDYEDDVDQVVNLDTN